MNKKWIWNLSLCYFKPILFLLLPFMMTELLRGKVIELGARDTYKLWGCIIPADQSAG